VTLIVGNKVSYPSQGPCLIGAVVKRIIDDRPMMFYQLLVLNNGGGNLFIPVDNVQTIGIRALLKKSEIPKLLDRLKQPTQSADTSRQRAINNQKLFASGSAFALAEVIEALTELRETKALSFGEHKALERAKMLLICEISEVTGETGEEAEQQIEQALKARNKQ